MTDRLESPANAKSWPRTLSRVFIGMVFGASLGLIAVSGWLSSRLQEYFELPELWSALTMPFWSEFLPQLLLGAALGGVAGAILGVLTRNLPRVSKAIAVATYLLFALLLLTAIYSVATAKERQALHDAESDALLQKIMGEWDRSYGAAYPREEATLPALLGPLYYPNGHLLDWPPPNPENEFQWAVTVATEDAMEQVLAHYMAVLPGGLWLDEELGFTCEPQPSEDNRVTTVNVQADAGRTLLRFVTQFKPSYDRRTMDAGPLPPPWPETMDERRARVANYQHYPLERVASELDPLVYPGARRVSTRFAYEQEPADPNGVYVSTDAWQTIFDYLREEFGPPANVGWFHFKKTITGEDGTPMNLYVSVDPNSPVAKPLGGVVLDHGLSPYVPERQGFGGGLGGGLGGGFGGLGNAATFSPSRRGQYAPPGEPEDATPRTAATPPVVKSQANAGEAAQ